MEPEQTPAITARFRDPFAAPPDPSTWFADVLATPGSCLQVHANERSR